MYNGFTHMYGFCYCNHYRWGHQGQRRKNEFAQNVCRCGGIIKVLLELNLLGKKGEEKKMSTAGLEPVVTITTVATITTEP